MIIHDFDAKFFEYARKWVTNHPGLTDKQVENSYNEIMLSWLNTPANWLDGNTPGNYFNRYCEPDELIAMVEEYDRRNIGLPEPLYARIVSLGECAVEGLMHVVRNTDKSEGLRASALAMLRDIGSDAARTLFVDLVSECDEQNELSEMAVDILSASDFGVVNELLERYETASEYGQMLILDICSNFPYDARIYDLCLEKLRNRPEQRAYYASLLGKLGDPRAIGELRKYLTLTDLTYFDYVEIRSSIEKLGGDAGEERAFYGDPDYEALRNI